MLKKIYDELAKEKVSLFRLYGPLVEIIVHAKDWHLTVQKVRPLFGEYIDNTERNSSNLSLTFYKAIKLLEMIPRYDKHKKYSVHIGNLKDAFCSI